MEEVNITINKKFNRVIGKMAIKFNLHRSYLFNRRVEKKMLIQVKVMN